MAAGDLINFSGTGAHPYSSPEYATKYLRGFSKTLAEFEDFSAFLRQLEKAVLEDSYLDGESVLYSSPKEAKSAPDFAKIESGTTILPIWGSKKELGYLAYKSRRDGRPFGAEDLHLMGTISDFISVLVAQAESHQNSKQAAQVLEYLIDQLPLGVVCFSKEGQLIVKNKLADQALGVDGLALVRKQLSEIPTGENERFRMHFEAGGKFLYSEGRTLRVGEQTTVSAFVIYDLSPSREKLLLRLERDILISSSRQTNLVIAQFHYPAKAGLIYIQLKEHAGSFGIDVKNVRPMNAHSCLCLFSGTSVATARALLRKNLAPELFENLNVSILEARDVQTDNDFAEEFLLELESSLADASSALKPLCAVSDPNPEVIDSLRLLTGETHQFVTLPHEKTFHVATESGALDLILMDADTLSSEKSDTYKNSSMELKSKLVWTSFRQPNMVRIALELAADAIILQKPFDSEAVNAALHSANSK